MTITLPLESQRWPWFRVLTRDSWGASGASGVSGGGWQPQIMQRPQPNQSGLILLSYSRALFPQTGTARIAFRYGKFLDRFIGASAASEASLKAGGTWDPTTDELEIPDFTGKEIRIQAAPRGLDDDPSSLEWETVFWGTCEYQTDEGFGGADFPSGMRTYHCADALFRLKRWPLDQHGFIDTGSGGSVISPAKGHPGWNVKPGAPGVTAGNKAVSGGLWTTQSGGSAVYHCMPGAGSLWTEEGAINNALAISRPLGEPLFTLSGATDLFEAESGIEVEEGATAWSVLEALCRRGRGKGAIRVEWTETSAEGALTPLLKVYAQLAYDINYQEPSSGGTVSIYGAVTNSTAVDVDVIGDHRFVPDSLVLGEAEQYQYDYTESLGEKIQTLATIAYEDSTLEKAWTDDEKDEFIALDPANRTDIRWRPVYQLHRLVRGFDCTVKNGNNSGSGRCDFQCDDTGLIVLPATSPTSPLTIKVMDDLPLYDGYEYDSTPVRSDGDSAATYAGTPPRRDPMVMVRNDDANYISIESMEPGVSFKIGWDGFLVGVSNDQGAGLRFFGDTGESDLQSVYEYDQLVMTIGIELPHRVRMATGNPNGKRKLRIIHRDIHLWVAHQGAIWDLDSANEDAGASPAKRAAASGTTGYAGLLRDDRDALARLHYLAVAWYGPLQNLLTGENESTRRGAQWSLRCCGDIPTSELYDGGGVVYPDVGQVVQYLYTNGQKLNIQTPVSSYTYDNEQGITTWVTDWQDLDFRQ